MLPGMKQHLTPFVALGLVFTAAPALAQEPSAQPTAAAPTTENPDDKIKCRSMPIIGSLSKKARICKTVAEWRKSRERGSEAAREVADYSRSRQMSN